MFGSSLAVKPSSGTALSHPDSHKLITAIRDQTEGIPPHLVYVIDIVSVKFGGYFTADVKAELERYQYLQMLTLNDCGIVSLQNFPHLPALIRLDLVFNSIPGEHLEYLKGSRHLQTIMMGANKVEKIQHLTPFKNFKQLLQLDLINNPLTKLPGYRVKVFEMLPTLSILDTLDKSGKDAYANSTMVEAVSRIPDNLFDKSAPIPPSPIVHVSHAPIDKKQKSKLKKALSRTGSLDKAIKPVNKPKTPISRGKSSKIGKIPAGRSKASKAGLVFPVGRIKRMLKERMVGNRVGGHSAIYLGAVLEYLTAQLVEIAGNMAKNTKKSRISPAMIHESLKGDQQMHSFLKNVVLRMGQ